MKHLEKYISILSIVSREFLVSQCFPARSSNKILDLAWLRCTWFCTRVHFSRSLTVQLRCWEWNKLRLDKFQHCAYLEAWFVSTLNFALSNTNLICCAHASKPYRILKMYGLVSSRFGIQHELQPRSQNHWNQHESNGLVELLVLRWDTLDSTRQIIQPDRHQKSAGNHCRFMSGGVEGNSLGRFLPGCGFDMA